VDQTPLPQRAWERQLDGATQPGRAIGDDQQRRTQPAGDQVLEEPGPWIGALVAAWCQPKQHRATSRRHAPCDQDRLGGRPRVVAEVGAVQEQVVQLHAAEVTGGEGVELLLDRLADPAHRRLAQGRLGPKRLGQRRLHISHRQATDETGQHEGFQGVGTADALAQQPGHNGWLVARSLGRSSTTGPAVVLTATG
jgi:hypothetical protein